MTDSAQLRHAKGTPDGGQWKETTRPDDIAPAEPLRLGVPGIDDRWYSPTEGDRVVVKADKRQRTIRYSDGLWRSRVPVAHRIVRLSSLSHDFRAISLVEAATAVITEMLEDGDMGVHKWMMHRAVDGIQGRYDILTLTGRNRRPLAAKDYTRGGPLEVSAIAHFCAMLQESGTIRLESRGKNHNDSHGYHTLLGRLNMRRFSEGLFAECRWHANKPCDYYCHNRVWHGTDGKLLHRMAQLVVNEGPLIDQWAANPKEARAAGPVALYLIGTTQAADPLHQKSMTIVEGISQAYYEMADQESLPEPETEPGKGTSPVDDKDAAFEKTLEQFRMDRGELISKDPAHYSLEISFRAMSDAVREAREPSAAEVQATHIIRSVLSNPGSCAARRVTDVWQGRIDELKSYGVPSHRYEHWERLLAGNERLAPTKHRTV